MKTRNIISILSVIFTLVMVSCSTEGDILDDMAKVETPATSSVEAAVSCSIYNNVMTKGDIDTLSVEGAEKNISNAIFFLVKGDDVLGCAKVDGGKIWTKNQIGLDVIAVAGMSKEKSEALALMTKVSEIKNFALAQAELDSFIKIGTKAVDFGLADATSANVTVEVAQRVARIDLVAVNYTSITAADNVELTKVEFVNQNLAGKLDGYAAAYNTNTISGENLNIIDAEKNVCDSFYSFANAEGADKQVSLKLTFKVDDLTVTRTFPVKHKGAIKVEAGCVYRITFNAKITGENVEPTVTFEVASWKESQVSGDMVEVK